LKRESRNALISTESQTNLLWKDGSQKDQSPEWALRRRSLTETRPGSTFICMSGAGNSSTGGRGWQDFIVIGDALAAFYPHMLGQLKEEYRLELLHNTVQGWIYYSDPGFNYPAQWDVYVARVIREAHDVGLPNRDCIRISCY
jgi:hypothetical protein